MFELLSVVQLFAQACVLYINMNLGMSVLPVELDCAHGH